MDIYENGIINNNSISEVGVTFGLIGWWKLDGDIIDYSGSDNDGTNSGATITSGLGQKAYSFNGVDSYISIPVTQTSPQQSVSIWFYPTSGVDGERIFWANGSNRFILALQSSSRLEFYTDTTVKSSGYLSTVLTYNLNSWNNVVITYNGSSTSIYVNGAEDTSHHSITGIVNPYSLNIGTNYSRSGDWFNGKIQDIRIYNRSLSSEEVKINYEMTNPESSEKVIEGSDGITYVNGEINEISL